MRKHLTLLLAALLAAGKIFAQGGDTISMPYLADFTQEWTATGGAVIVDSNHAVLSGEGQQLISPWITVEDDSYQGYFLWADLRREGNEDPNDAVHFIMEYESSEATGDTYTEDYLYWITDIENGYYDGHIWPGMGKMRVTVTYDGCAGSQLHVSNFASFHYPIQVDIETDNYEVSVGDTIRVHVHATLPDGTAPDSVAWWSWQNEASFEDHPAYSIVDENDSVLTIVMNARTRVSVYSTAYKFDVLGGHHASGGNDLMVTCFDRPFYEEDSIYYTSTAKDTVLGCHYKLNHAVLPEGVKVVTDSAFYRREQLNYVDMPQSLEYIGRYAFLDNWLMEITIPENVTYIGDGAFDGTPAHIVHFNARSCTYMGSSASSGAFYWSSLRKIVIGEHVRRIPDYAFTYCYCLSDTLTIPDEVEYIGEQAFISDLSNCGNPLSVVIGRTVNHIGDLAFYRPDHIVAVTMRNPSAPAVNGTPFPVLDCPLVVPCGAHDTYMAAPYWGEWGEIEENCNGIANAEPSACIDIHVYDGRIVVVPTGSHVERPEVSVYSVDGRRVDHGRKQYYRVPVSGTYMVKVEGQPARRLVVIK